MLNVMTEQDTRGDSQPDPDAIRSLEYVLREAGLDHVYGYTDGTVGCLSVRCGLTVWYRRGELTWTVDGKETRWPVTDVAGAADALLEAAAVSA
jgi:hypothetical protein